MSKIEELDSLLQSLQALKPPGASKSKIASITSICLENVQLDATIAQKLYSHFKKSPATHKLGILFVVDSVTRQWIEKAKSAGQELGGSSAPNGTYASGVQRITELMPSLLDDMARLAPQDQKVKVNNLVDIWERSNTFPTRMLTDYKQKVSAGNTTIASRTPPGSPPSHVLRSLGLSRTSSQQPLQPTSGAPPLPPQVNPNDAAGLLQALAGMGNPAQRSPMPMPPALQQSNGPDIGALLAGFGQQVPAAKPPTSYQAPPQTAQYPPISFPQSQPPPLPAFPPQLASLFPSAAPLPLPVPPAAAQAPPTAQDPLAALTTLIPPHILNNPQKLAETLQLLNDLAKANIPQDQWGQVLAALNAPGPEPSAQPSGHGWQPESQHDRSNGSYGEYDSSSRRRDRSRSPDYRRDRNSNIQRRPSPVYGNYDASTKMVRDESNDGGRQNSGRYRQRSPPTRSNGLTSPPPAFNPAAPAASGPKWVSYDATLPRNHIKVLSRTLFVGGCTATEPELRAIFSRFGQVQTCITNNDKRHAFVKMSNRAGAVAAKQGMEDLSVHDPGLLSKARQTKWGVGFGPRECCDYSTGESTIPISSLTEADIKWALTAEYGGTGGREVVSGMVMEEPDIEIGAGVSSKAMSRRVGPDGGKNRGGGGRNDGNKQGRGRQGGGNTGGGYGGANGQQQGGYGQSMGGAGAAGQMAYGMPPHQQAQQQQRPPQQQQQQQQQVAYVQPPPPVPNFGFQFAMPGSGGPSY